MGFTYRENAIRFDRNEKAVFEVRPYLVAPPSGDQNLPHLQKPLLEYTQGKAQARFKAVIISIYCLKDPGTGETMYVGATRAKPLTGHTVTEGAHYIGTYQMMGGALIWHYLRPRISRLSCATIAAIRLRTATRQ